MSRARGFVHASAATGDADQFDRLHREAFRALVMIVRKSSSRNPHPKSHRAGSVPPRPASRAMTACGATCAIVCAASPVAICTGSDVGLGCRRGK